MLCSIKGETKDVYSKNTLGDRITAINYSNTQSHFHLTKRRGMDNIAH